MCVCVLKPTRAVLTRGSPGTFACILQGPLLGSKEPKRCAPSGEGVVPLLVAELATEPAPAQWLIDFQEGGPDNTCWCCA